MSLLMMSFFSIFSLFLSDFFIIRFLTNIISYSSLLHSHQKTTTREREIFRSSNLIFHHLRKEVSYIIRSRGIKNKEALLFRCIHRSVFEIDVKHESKRKVWIIKLCTCFLVPLCLTVNILFFLPRQKEVH